MKLWNFTGFNLNFAGGFSGSQVLPSGPTVTLWNPNRYQTLFGSQSTTGQSVPLGLTFKPDGSIVYYCGSTNEIVRSFDLSTPWDITTATNNQAASGVLLDTLGATFPTPTGIVFADSGNKLLVLDSTNNKLYEYALGTAWDITTLNTTAAAELALSGTGRTNPAGIYIDPTDTLITISLTGTAGVVTYTLGTPGDITTASITANITTGSIVIRSVQFIDNGTLALCTMNDVQSDRVYIATMSTPYVFETLGTGTNLIYYGVVQTGGNTWGYAHQFKPDGTAFYYVNLGIDEIIQYNVTPGPAPLYVGESYTVYNGNYAVASSFPADLDFKSDGSMVFVIDYNVDRAYSATLSTPWDINTAGSNAFSSQLYASDGVTALTTPTGISVSTDGTKLFVVDQSLNSGTLLEYTLHTPYDVTTAGVTSGDGIATQEVQPTTISAGNVYGTTSVRFNATGTKCATVNTTSPQRIVVWDLSTPWDISTISENNFSNPIGTSLVAVHWNSDGTKIWVEQSASSVDNVYYYELTTPYDVSGITSGNFVSRRDMDMFEASPGGIYMKEDGSSLYLVGTGVDRVIQLKTDL